MGRRCTKQLEIYEYIKKVINEKGYPPTVREICSAVGLSSTSTVHSHLKTLQKNGFIKRDPSKPRAIEIIKESSIKNNDLINIPIVGNVAAGKPILALENVEGYLPVSINLIRNNNELFALHIKGSSMIEAGILNGDTAIIEKRNTAENGDIVVASIEKIDGGEVTLKRFFKEKDHYRLQPENSSMNPIIVSDCKIVGKLVALIREYQ